MGKKAAGKSSPVGRKPVSHSLGNGRSLEPKSDFDSASGRYRIKSKPSALGEKVMLDQTLGENNFQNSIRRN